MAPPPPPVAPRRSIRLHIQPLPPTIVPEPESASEVVESVPVESEALDGFGEAIGFLAAAPSAVETGNPSPLSSPATPSYPSPTGDTPPAARFDAPLFMPTPLFLPDLSSPIIPAVVPTAVSDGLEGSDPGLDTSQGRLRPPQLPAHPSVFGYEEAVRRRQQAQATFDYSRTALVFAIEQEENARKIMEAAMDAAAAKAAQGSRRK